MIEFIDDIDASKIDDCVIDYLNKLGIRLPDLEIIPYCEYIDNYSELVEHGMGKDSYKPGVYAFFDPGKNSYPIFLYIGKSVKIKYRIKQHMGDTRKSGNELRDWVNDYYDIVLDKPDSKYSGVILCLIWFENGKHNEQLEMELIEKLNPIFNVQRPTLRKLSKP